MRNDQGVCFMKSSLGKKGRSQSAIGALECGCFDRKELVGVRYHGREG